MTFVSKDEDQHTVILVDIQCISLQLHLLAKGLIFGELANLCQNEAKKQSVGWGFAG